MYTRNSNACSTPLRPRPLVTALALAAGSALLIGCLGGRGGASGRGARGDRATVTLAPADVTALALAAGSALLIGCLGGGGGSSDRGERGDRATVTLANGEVRGRVADDTLIWHGIPYAQAPVGELRWRAPQPPEDWSGTLDAR